MAKTFEERHEALKAAVEDVRNGMSATKAAAKYGLQANVILGGCLYAGVQSRHHGKRGDTRTLQAMALIASGETVAKAAAQAGCSAEAVYRRFRAMAGAVVAEAAE